MLDALIQKEDLTDNRVGRRQWENMVDSLVQDNDLPSVSNENSSKRVGDDTVARQVLAYIGGSLSKKSKVWSNCKECAQTLLSVDIAHDDFQLIRMVSRGYLKYPSSRLVDLMEKIEKIVLRVVNDQGVARDTLFEITSELSREKVPLLGCSKPMHDVSFSKTIISFYLLMRMEFLVKRHNKIVCDKSNKLTKKCRKNAKLT